MAVAETFSLSENDSQEIRALVKAGFYTSKSDVAKDALRCLLEHKPDLRVNVAIQLYKEEEISLGRAAEISRMNILDFKEVLADRGLVKVHKTTKKDIDRGRELIKKLRKKK